MRKNRSTPQEKSKPIGFEILRTVTRKWLRETGTRNTPGDLCYCRGGPATRARRFGARARQHATCNQSLGIKAEGFRFLSRKPGLEHLGLDQGIWIGIGSKITLKMPIGETLRVCQDREIHYDLQYSGEPCKLDGATPISRFSSRVCSPSSSKKGIIPRFPRLGYARYRAGPRRIARSEAQFVVASGAVASPSPRIARLPP